MTDRQLINMVLAVIVLFAIGIAFMIASLK